MQTSDHGTASILTTLFAHNTWANLKLLEFCERLSDAQLDATAVGCFGSVRGTLIHIIGAELSYVERVNGKRSPQAFARGASPGFGQLKEAARWAGDALLQLALSTRQGATVREQKQGMACEYPLASLLVQEVTHAAEHRTQVATIITQLGLEPPDMSGWQYMVETGEFREFPVERQGA